MKRGGQGPAEWGKGRGGGKTSLNGKGGGMLEEEIQKRERERDYVGLPGIKIGIWKEKRPNGNVNK